MNGRIEEERQLVSIITATRMYFGLSQEQVAKTLGFSRSTVTQLEHGNRKVSALDLHNIAQLYRMPMTFFLPSSDDRISTPSETDKLPDSDKTRILNYAYFIRTQSQPEGILATVKSVNKEERERAIQMMGLDKALELELAWLSEDSRAEVKGLEEYKRSQLKGLEFKFA